MESSPQEFWYADLHQVVEYVLVNSPWSMVNSFGLGQSNSLLIGRWDPWMPLPSPRPDDDLSFAVDSPIEEPTSELEEADFTSAESPSSMDSLPFFETNSASYHSWSQIEPVAAEGKKYPKPNLSHTYLTALAMKNSKEGRVRVPEIYSFLKLHFPHFENVTPGWKKAVRHNLSNNEYFVKIARDTGGCVKKRGNLWEIESAHATQVCKDLREKMKKHEQQLRRAMRNPKDFDRLVKGEMKSSFSEVTMRRVAKRRTNGKGKAQLSHVYPPAKHTKTDLTIDATAEE